MYHPWKSSSWDISPGGSEHFASTDSLSVGLPRTWATWSERYHWGESHTPLPCIVRHVIWPVPTGYLWCAHPMTSSQSLLGCSSTFGNYWEWPIPKLTNHPNSFFHGSFWVGNLENELGSHVRACEMLWDATKPFECQKHKKLCVVELGDDLLLQIPQYDHCWVLNHLAK